MSQPTDPAARHLAGDHTECRPGQCLAARHDQGQPAPAEPGPHGAWPATTLRADWQDGATDTCSSCAAPIEYVVRDDDSPMAGIGGWRHVPPGDKPAGGAA